MRKQDDAVTPVSDEHQHGSGEAAALGDGDERLQQVGFDQGLDATIIELFDERYHKHSLE
jgi:hypothetical protein